MPIRFLTVFLLLFIALTAAPGHGEPALAGLRTGAQVREHQIAVERAVLAAYPLKELDAETLIAVNLFFDSAARAFVEPEQEQDFPSRATWRHAQAITPLVLACDDPLVQLLVHEAVLNAWFSIPGHRLTDVESDLRAVRANGLPEERIAAIAASMITGPTNERKAITEIAIEATANAMRRPGLDVDEKRRMYNALFRAAMSFSQAQLQELEKRLESDPPADPWLANAVIGSRLTHLAWVNRSSLFNHRPREESMRIAASLLERARPMLVAAHEQEPACPEPAAMMMSVVLGGQRLPGEHSRDWFARVQAAQQDFRPAFGRMRAALLQRWGGDPDELKRFALRCAAQDLVATDAPIEAYQAVRFLVAEIGKESVWNDRELIDTVQNALESCLAADPPPERAEEVRHALINLFEATGRKPAAAALLRENGGEVDFWLRRSWLRHHTPYAPRLLVYDTPARPIAALADAAEDIGDWTSAADFWRSAAELVDPNTDPQAHAAIVERILAADRARQLATGEWLDLGFADGLTGFRVLQGVFEPISAASVRMYREQWYFHKTAVGVFDLPVSGHYEVEATIQPGFGKVGILVGLRPYKPRNEGFTRIAVSQQELHVEYSYRAPVKKVKLTGQLGSPVKLRVVVNGESLEIFADGERVFQGDAPLPRISWGNRIGLAAEQLAAAGERASRTTVSDFRVRLIAPAPERDDALPAAKEDDEFFWFY